MGQAFKIIFGGIIAVVLAAVLVYVGYYAYKANPTAIKDFADATKTKVESVMTPPPVTAPASTSAPAPAPTSAPAQKAVADVVAFGAGAVEGAACTGQTTGKPGIWKMDPIAIWKMDPIAKRLGCWVGTEK